MNTKNILTIIALVLMIATLGITVTPIYVQEPIIVEPKGARDKPRKKK